MFLFGPLAVVRVALEEAVTTVHPIGLILIINIIVNIVVVVAGLNTIVAKVAAIEIVGIT